MAKRVTVERRELGGVVKQNYLEYALDVILNRSIPGIDGFKPVQRRALYTMYLMKLMNGSKTKSANVVGQILKLHPHGDGSVYQALVRLTDCNESLVLPYVDGKGNFGKNYSSTAPAAASRYTECKLEKYTEDILFEGINKGAVDLIPSYDNEGSEPLVLPVAVPTVLVSTSKGIAVGVSSNIPSFELASVIEATEKLINDSETSEEELAEIMKLAFTARASIYRDKKQMLKLMRTGRGSFLFKSAVELYSGRIEVVRLPHGVTVEDLMEDVIQLNKKGKLQFVSNIEDETDISGMRVAIFLKRGTDENMALKELYKLTCLRKKVSFLTSIVYKGEFLELSVKELLLKWIEFRRECVTSMKEREFEVKERACELERAWVIIDESISIASNIESRTESEATKWLLSKGLSKVQAEYVLKSSLRKMSVDKRKESIIKLDIKEKELIELRRVIDDVDEIDKIIVEKMNKIKETGYGVPRNKVISEYVEEKDIVEVEEVKKVKVMVYGSRVKVIEGEVREEDENLVPDKEFRANSDGQVLIFTRYGVCHKISISDILKGSMRGKDIVKETKIIDMEEVLYIDILDEDREGRSLKVIYPDGKGKEIPYSSVSGNRSKYISLYNLAIFATVEEEFFIITNKRKAAFKGKDLITTGNRKSFKVGSIKSRDDEEIIGVVSRNKIDISEKELLRFRKGYTVKIHK